MQKMPPPPPGWKNPNASECIAFQTKDAHQDQKRQKGKTQMNKNMSVDPLRRMT